MTWDRNVESELKHLFILNKNMKGVCVHSLDMHNFSGFIIICLNIVHLGLWYEVHLKKKTELLGFFIYVKIYAYLCKMIACAETWSKLFTEMYLLFKIE